MQLSKWFGLSAALLILSPLGAHAQTAAAAGSAILGCI